MNFTNEAISYIRERSEEADREKSLPSHWIDFIVKQQLFKLYVPKSLNGNMTTLPAAIRLIEDASWIDGNFGWSIMIGSGGGFFAPFFDSETAVRVYSPQEAVIAGSGTPSGVAKRVPGGYIVSGQWKYCSGASYASVFTANCRVIENENNSNELTFRAFAFRSHQVQITKDWNSFGLRATESHSFSVKDLFVPDDMTFDILSEKKFSDPIYRYPFLQFAQLTTVSVTVGLGRRLLEEVKKWFVQNQENWETTNRDKFFFVMERLRKSQATFDEAILHYHHALDSSWSVIAENGSLSDEEWMHVTKVCKHVARVALQCAERLFPYTGIPALMETSVINRTWRDLQTAAHHSLLTPFCDE